MTKILSIRLDDKIYDIIKAKSDAVNLPLTKVAGFLLERALEQGRLAEIKPEPPKPKKELDIYETLCRWWQERGQDPQVFWGVKGRAEAIGMTFEDKLEFAIHMMLDHGIL